MRTDQVIICGITFNVTYGDGMIDSVTVGNDTHDVYDNLSNSTIDQIHDWVREADSRAADDAAEAKFEMERDR